MFVDIDFVLCVKVLTSWLVSAAAVGARGDLQGIDKKKYCPACKDITDEMFALTLQHVLQMCEATTAYREAVGLAAFFADSKARGHCSRAAYTLYLTGRAPDGSCISRSDYMKRGSVLENLRKEWLSMWT